MNTMKMRLGGLAAGAMLAAGLATGGAVIAAAPAQSADTSVQDICLDAPEVLVRWGSRGSSVSRAQCLVNYSLTGDNINVDGIFGQQTYNMITRFQACAGLSVDGIVGPNTWRELKRWANSPYHCN